jgi:hypothetical protein
LPENHSSAITDRHIVKCHILFLSFSQLWICHRVLILSIIYFTRPCNPLDTHKQSETSVSLSSTSVQQHTFQEFAMQTIRNVIRRVVKPSGMRQPEHPPAGIPARSSIRAGYTTYTHTPEAHPYQPLEPTKPYEPYRPTTPDIKAKGAPIIR